MHKESHWFSVMCLGVPSTGKMGKAVAWDFLASQCSLLSELWADGRSHFKVLLCPSNKFTHTFMCTGWHVQVHICAKFYTNISNSIVINVLRPGEYQVKSLMNLVLLKRDGVMKEGNPVTQSTIWLNLVVPLCLFFHANEIEECHKDHESQEHSHTTHTISS